LASQTSHRTGVHLVVLGDGSGDSPAASRCAPLPAGGWGEPAHAPNWPAIRGAASNPDRHVTGVQLPFCLWSPSSIVSLTTLSTPTRAADAWMTSLPAASAVCRQTL